MDLQNINSTFSPKSDLILTDLMKRYSLGEPGDLSELILTKLTMSLSNKEITENENVRLLREELNLSQQIAEQITEEIKNNLIPTLWDKMSEKEKESLLEDKNKKIDPSIFKAPAFINIEDNKKLLKEEKQPEKISIPKKNEISAKTIKKPTKELKEAENVEDVNSLSKNPLKPERPKSSRPDSYREPIE